eukprot:1748602-Pleurochrysis_carterae.AAC.1
MKVHRDADFRKYNHTAMPFSEHVLISRGQVGTTPSFSSHRAHQLRHPRSTTLRNCRRARLYAKSPIDEEPRGIRDKK